MESIQLTGNKAQFNNYLTDPLIIPRNAKVCLNKASFSIPVWTQKFITLPSLDAADRAKNMLTVYVAGVSNGITWTEFYTAWDTLNDVEARTEAEFYNGTYELYVNNLLLLNDGLTNKTLPSFSNILAKALETKFDFFSFSASNEVLENKYVDVVAGDTLTVNGVAYLVNPTPLEIKNHGITADYAPELVTTLTPVDMDANWSLVDCARVGANSISLNGTTGTSMAIAKILDDQYWAIDPNGGYWNFRPDLDDNPITIVCGVVFTNEESQINTTTPTVVVNDDIVVGFKFQYDGTTHSYQTIDGLQEFSHGTHADVEQSLYPKSNLFKFANDVDEFFIQIRRAANYEANSGKYIFRLMHGDVNNQGIGNADCVYQTEITVPSPDVLCIPIIRAEYTASPGTSHVRANKIVNITDDSIDMGAELNIFSDNSFHIIPSIDDGSSAAMYQFFDAIGLHQDEDNDRTKHSYNGTALSHSITWQSGKKEKKYFVGVNQTESIFRNNEAHIKIQPGQVELPRQIEISLLNTAHTPHTGSFAQEVLFTQPDINKVISYINTDSLYFDADSNIYLEYVYEAFNLVCRRLKNRDKLPLNNFQIKLGYKNFITNSEEPIEQLRGTVKLEILFETDTHGVDE